MTKFYDRIKELNSLEQIEKTSLNSANFTVMTGRRRIGKTVCMNSDTDICTAFV